MCVAINAVLIFSWRSVARTKSVASGGGGGCGDGLVKEENDKNSRLHIFLSAVSKRHGTTVVVTQLFSPFFDKEVSS